MYMKIFAIINIHKYTHEFVFTLHVLSVLVVRSLVLFAVVENVFVVLLSFVMFLLCLYILLVRVLLLFLLFNLLFNLFRHRLYLFHVFKRVVAFKFNICLCCICVLVLFCLCLTLLLRLVPCSPSASHRKTCCTHTYPCTQCGASGA